MNTKNKIVTFFSIFVLLVSTNTTKGVKVKFERPGSYLEVIATLCATPSIVNVLNQKIIQPFASDSLRDFSTWLNPTKEMSIVALGLASGLLGINYLVQAYKSENNQRAFNFLLGIAGIGGAYVGYSNIKS